MVDVCDVDPAFGFGVLSSLVGRGRVTVLGELVSVKTPTRVKAAEALGMCARRRSEGGVKFELLRDAMGVIMEVFREGGAGGREGQGREVRRMIDKNTRGWFEKVRKGATESKFLPIHNLTLSLAHFARRRVEKTNSMALRMRTMI